MGTGDSERRQVAALSGNSNADSHGNPNSHTYCDGYAKLNSKTYTYTKDAT